MAMTKAEVREAFREVMAADYADVPKREEIDHTFSPEFYARMDALIAEQKRGAWRMMPRQRKRVLVVAAILAATLMLVACSPVLRHAVARLVVTIYESFMDYTIDSHETELRTEIETVYELDPVPEGFEIVSQNRLDPYSIETVYTNGLKESIIIIQVSTCGFVGSTDAEYSATRSRTVAGVEVLFSFADEFQMATMLCDGYYFNVRYIGTITQAEFEALIRAIALAE